MHCTEPVRNSITSESMKATTESSKRESKYNFSVNTVSDQVSKMRIFVIPAYARNIVLWKAL